MRAPLGAGRALLLPSPLSTATRGLAAPLPSLPPGTAELCSPPHPAPPHPPAAATAYVEEDFIIHVGVPGAFVLHPGVLDTHRGQLLRHKRCLSAQRLPQHRPPRGGRCPPARAACPAPGSTTPTLAAGEPPAPSALGTSRPPALPSAQRPSPWCSAQGCSHPRCPAPAPELTPGPKAPHGPPPPLTAPPAPHLLAALQHPRARAQRETSARGQGTE